MKMTARRNIALIRMIAKLEPRDMTASERASFAGADVDAQIAKGDYKLAELICEMTGEAISTEGETEVVTVIFSGESIEIIAMTPDCEPVCVSLNLLAL